jgi:glycosyltransferase involved in cell wall biosynthesis
VIDTFKKLNASLVVSGSGSEFEKYKKKTYKNIKFVFKPTDSELVKLYSNAKAFLMPQEEDFGITAVEAQSFGVPVIAYNKGGSLDTVIESKTGILFNEQTVKSLTDAVAKFDTVSFNGGYLRTNAERFSKEKFKEEFLNQINKV